MSTPRIAEPRVQAVPTTMRAAAIDQFGPSKVLTLHTLPTPKSGSGEVLIAMHAAGVGVWDAEARKGSYASGRERFPLVLGTDGAGVVVDRGARVRRHDVDDRVWAYEFSNPKGGFYAEYVAVNAERVGRVPRRLNLLQAGAAAVTGLTALQGVDDHLQVKEDETVLIFGAAGAVGGQCPPCRTVGMLFGARPAARVQEARRSQGMYCKLSSATSPPTSSMRGRQLRNTLVAAVQARALGRKARRVHVSVTGS